MFAGGFLHAQDCEGVVRRRPHHAGGGQAGGLHDNRSPGARTGSDVFALVRAAGRSRCSPRPAPARGGRLSRRRTAKAVRLTGLPLTSPQVDFQDLRVVCFAERCGGDTRRALGEAGLEQKSVSSQLKPPR